MPNDSTLPTEARVMAAYLRGRAEHGGDPVVPGAHGPMPCRAADLLDRLAEEIVRLRGPRAEAITREESLRR